MPGLEYPFTKGAPSAIAEAEYFKRLHKDFSKLLATQGDNEKVFQQLFEKNPCLVPGARAEMDGWPSGHGPLYETLITQPKLPGLKTRVPDFLWLAFDSLVFNPIFIEIEAPNKKYFNGDGTTTRDFNQARTQVEEWEAILEDPAARMSFIRDYNIPGDIVKKKFEPYCIIVYGRRQEYDGNDWLSSKRASLQKGSLRIMSYDRIAPTIARRNYVCCEVNGGVFQAKTLSPTFTLGPNRNSLLSINGLVEAVDSMGYTSKERKAFLRTKIPICLNYLRSPNRKSLKLPNPKEVGQTVE